MLLLLKGPQEERLMFIRDCGPCRSEIGMSGLMDPDIRYSGLCLIQFDSCTAQSLGLFELLSKLLGPGLSKKVTLVHLAALTNSNPSRVQSIAF